MVKLGQTTRGTNHGCKYLWLVKNMQVYRNYDKKACYEVLAFNCNAWFVLYSGTLVDCKKFIANEEIVESLEEDTKRQKKEVSTVETSEVEESTEDHNEYDEISDLHESTDRDRNKEVMEVKQELNARFGKEQYFDTDTLQPNNIAKIENINHCPNQNTCCIVSPFVHCDYNYKSDDCIKAHKNFIHNCEQVHKQMKAKNNPEWHHVSLATLANIDNDMLDNKRRLYFTVRNELNKTLKNLHKCNSGLSYKKTLSPLIRWIMELYFNKKITSDLKRYVDIKISMCNVECGVWSSAVEEATGQHESRKYNRPTLRY